MSPGLLFRQLLVTTVDAGGRGYVPEERRRPPARPFRTIGGLARTRLNSPE
jgi:hypothetical protein